MARKKQGRSSADRKDGTKDADARDAIAILTQDHRDVEALFEQYREQSTAAAPEGDEAPDKAALIRQICASLTLHAALEEEIFYPACREAEVDHDLMNEAQVEHDTAKVLLIDLAEAAADDPYVDAKVTVLCEYIRHHVAEEEKPGEGIFAKAKAVGIDLKDLGNRLQERRTALEAGMQPDDEMAAGSSEDMANRLRPVSLRVASVRVITGTGQEHTDMGRQYGQERDDRYGYSQQGRQSGRERWEQDRDDQYRGDHQSRDQWDRDDREFRGRGDDRERSWDGESRYEGRGGYESRWDGGNGIDQRYGRDRGQQFREQQYGNRFMGDRGMGDSGRGRGGPSWSEDNYDYREQQERYSSRPQYDDREDRYGRRDDYDRAESPRFRGQERDEQPRDDQGRFMSERDQGGNGYRSRGRDDDNGRERSRSGRDQGGRDQGGWFGEPRRHAEAARLGWRHRQ